MFSKALFVLAAAALAVNAQGSSTATSPAPSGSTAAGGVSPCVLACVVPAAAQNGCSGPTDLPCVCTNLQFQSDAGACLQEYCTPADIQSALGLQQQGCSAAGLSATSTVTPTPRPVSYTSAGAVPTGASSAGKPSGSPSGSSASKAASPSPSASKAAASNVQVGAGAFFGAILATFFAL